MAEVLYLDEVELSGLVRRKFRVESVAFGHNEEFLADEPEGMIAMCEGKEGEPFETTVHYLDLLDAVQEYIEGLRLEFCGCRLFTRVEGIGAALLVKRR